MRLGLRLRQRLGVGGVGIRASFTLPGAAGILGLLFLATPGVPQAAGAASGSGAGPGSARAASAARAAVFTLEQVKGAPFPTELVASPVGSRIAWVFDERGARNVWAAEGPAWQARRVTSYTADDGQELTNLAFSADGNTLVYVRGGDHDSNWAAEGNLAPDPTGSPQQPKVQIWAVPFAGGAAPRLLADGDEPAVGPRGVVAFTRDRAIWSVPLDGSAPARRMFFARGESGAPTWSPDGARLAFVSGRGDHAFIGVFADTLTPIRWLAPSTGRDSRARWSPDGRSIAFVRQPGGGGAPETLLELHPRPWAIWTADASTGLGRAAWRSPATLRGSIPTTDGGPNLHWAAADRLVFLADLDGWPHLYSVPAAGGEPTLLTPDRGMAEHVALSPDRRFLVFAGNMGKGRDDLERRHVFRVAVDRPGVTDLTPGEGLAWSPVVTADNGTVALIVAGARTPPLPAVLPARGGQATTLAADQVPADFPAAALVEPRAVVFRAADGVEVHADLFDAGHGAGRRPAVVFVHGGPPRQMLLGWHYSRYYSNAFALNQYLASRGYVVLAVNYRLGIGYGHEFHHPEHGGAWGASEYQDVKAAGEYLRALPQVDPARIGIWGGSYGGYLTALALARNSDLFAAGVDLHGVHDWTEARTVSTDRVEKPADYEQARQVMWKSSPIADLGTWKSPVLLIQGDDDRNVRFHQTVDLARRLEAQGVRFEEIVIPDEIHDFLRHASWLRADQATADFFDRVFGAGERAAR